MSSNRPRGQSPPRYYSDQPRSTTGTVYVTSFDTNSRGGSSSSSQPRASVTAVPSGRHSVAYQAQPMRKSTFADGKTKTEYAIRPRNDSYSPHDAKRPLSISTRNSSPPRRDMALVASPRQITPTVVRDDPNRSLQPVSSHSNHHGTHHRHNSTSMADLDPREVNKEKREKSYHTKAPYVQRAYHDSRPPARASDEEQWSYTGPREQFDRDYPQRPAPPREGTTRRERPAGYYEADRPVAKRDSVPPPSAGKDIVRRDKGDPNRYDAKAGFESDPDRGSEIPKRRNSARPPVLHQQFLRDDGYSSARDDYDSRSQAKHRDSRYDDEIRPRERQRDAGREVDRERDYNRKYHRDSDRERPRDYDRDYGRDHERDYDRDERPKESRRKPRSRENSPERSGLKALATTALGSLAAAGVVKGFNRDQKDKEVAPDESDERERRHKKHRHRSRKDDQYEEPDLEDERRRDDRARPRPQDDSSSETPDDQPPKRHSSRRRRREDDDTSGTKPAPPDEQAPRSESRVRTRDAEESSPGADRPSREMVPAHKQDQELEYLESRTISPGENEDDRPRRVQLVEPVKEKDEVKPRGILKPARQVPFPEDPNPIREGVAPLKDATKDGIPPNARWTKINRLLVNPEALEKAHERFEEREDYVIVLRVLSREEIKKLADMTVKIRDARERDTRHRPNEERNRQTGDESDANHSDGEVDYDANENRPRSQLAIEPGPQAPPADLYSLHNPTNQPVYARGVPGGPPIPDINVDANYSQNV